MRVSEIRVQQIRVNQGLGVLVFILKSRRNDMDRLCVFLFGCLVSDTYDNLLLIFFQV